MSADTIVALATAPGRAGIGVIRLSGPAAARIARELGAANLTPRYAHYCHLREGDEVVDSGLCLYFRAPHSFTGEDVIEIQAHGSPVTLRRLIRLCLGLGARLANPGEFSQRAFLNGRIDLAQAEAIADLIASGSESAARASMRSLDGVFSRIVDQLSQQIIDLRKYVETSIDFAEEEIDFLSDGRIAGELEGIETVLQQALTDGRKGQKLIDGLSLVILGQPNAGKSSLLNYFAGDDRAIVTDIAGTTRDTLSETVDLDGLPVTITDTAGLNSNPDPVEKIGMQKALQSASKADLLLVLFDDSKADPESTLELLRENNALPADLSKILLVANKIDLSGNAAGPVPGKGTTTTTVPGTEGFIRISVKQGLGLSDLVQELKQRAGLEGEAPSFSARARHLLALEWSLQHIQAASTLLEDVQAGELVAEELKLAHLNLQEITGTFRTDDLLGEIFSSFCVGK